MYKFLMILSAFALLILLVVTFILVKLNWSEKLYNPLLSLGLAGTVTTFITVLLMLKGQENERSFTTLVIIDSATHLPPFIIPLSTNSLSNRLSDYRNLTISKANVNGKEQVFFKVPQNDSEETVFYEELLQYSIFKAIVGMQRESQSFSHDFKAIKSSVHKPFKLSESEKKTFRFFLPEISKNRFSNNFHDQQELKFDFPFSKLPLKLKLEFRRIPSSEKTGVEKHLIILTKPYYFTIEIIIEASFDINNVTPAGLNITPEIAKKCKTSMFVVTMKSKFEKITAGNWRTEELKNWSSWLFDGIETRFSDDYNR